MTGQRNRGLGRGRSTAVLAGVFAAALAVSVVGPVPASAQGIYAGAALTGDIARYDRVDGLLSSGRSRDGEALGFALRLGTPLGSIWGVELEFARPALIEGDLSAGSLLSSSAGITLPGVPVISIPDLFTSRVRAERRNTTISAGLWAAQELSSRVSLAYLGGIAFLRTSTDTEYSVERTAGSPRLPIALTPVSIATSSTTYDVRPFVGIEARVVMTEHLRLVPGLRLHGLPGGWLLRPAVGLSWVF